MYVAPPPPRESPAADRPTRRPPRFGSTKGGGGGLQPQNGRTPLGVAHWLAAAPVLGAVIMTANIRAEINKVRNS